MYSNASSQEKQDFLLTYENNLPCSGEVFQDFQLIDQQLDDGDFSGAIFEGVVFNNCDLSGASFSTALFNSCHFVGCELEGCDFSDIVMESVSFTDCQLEGIRLSESEIQEVAFTRCNGRINFSYSTITKGFFTYCSMWQSALRSTKVADSVLFGCDISQMELNSVTDLIRVTIEKCDITDTDFKSANGMMSTSFENCLVSPFSPRLLPKKQTELPLSRRLPPAKSESKGGVNFNIYRGVDKTARLYCSDRKEYEEVR